MTGFSFDEVVEVLAQPKDIAGASLDLLFSYARQMGSKECSPRIIYVSTGDNLSTMLAQSGEMEKETSESILGEMMAEGRLKSVTVSNTYQLLALLDLLTHTLHKPPVSCERDANSNSKTKRGEKRGAGATLVIFERLDPLFSAQKTVGTGTAGVGAGAGRRLAETRDQQQQQQSRDMLFSKDSLVEECVLKLQELVSSQMVLCAWLGTLESRSGSFAVAGPGQGQEQAYSSAGAAGAGTTGTGSGTGASGGSAGGSILRAGRPKSRACLAWETLVTRVVTYKVQKQYDYL